MAIARLSIDLEARLAGLQAGLDKAGVLAEKQAAKIDRAFAGLRATAAGVGVAFAAIIPAAVVGQFARFFSSTVDGLDKLNDLSDATGASVENLSALEDIALRTGTSLDTAGDAVIKLSKALADAKPGTDQAAAFKALGLSVEELKRLDPVEAFQKLSIALAGFADDGNKARLVQELFGKSLKEVAPLLRDMAEAGKLNATVTTEQAQAAEAFNKQIFALQKNVADAARVVAGPMVQAINDLIEAFRKGQKEGQGFLSFMAARFSASNKGFFGEGDAERVNKLTEQIERLDAQLAQNVAMDQRRIGLLELRKKLTNELAQAQAALGAADGSNYGNEGRRQPMALPSLPASITPPPKTKAAKDTSLGAAPPSQAMTDALRAIEQTDVIKVRALNEALDELFNLRASGIGGDASIDQAIANLRDELEKLDPALQQAAADKKRLNDALAFGDDIKEANARLTVALVEDEAARARALIALDEAVLLKKLDSLKVYGQAYDDAQAQIKAQTELRLRSVDQAEEEAKKTTAMGKDVGQELGLVFSSAAGQAIVQFNNLRDVLQGVLQDIAQIAMRDLVTKPLSEAISGALKGFSLASLLGSAKGNAFGASGVIPFARGGIVDKPTLFPFAKGTGLMGEAGPEAILPLKRGAGGQLGVQASGQGRAVSVHYAPVIHIDSRTDQAQVAALVAQSVQQGNAQMLRHLQAQGVLQ